MKININKLKIKKMKKIFFIVITTLFIISCIDNTGKSTNSNYDQSQVKEDNKKEQINISIGDLISLFENISNIDYINNKLDSLDYKKKFNGVYISNEQISVNEPKHWLRTNDIGSFSSVSYSTVEKPKWIELLIEIKKYGNPIPFDDGSSSKSIRYIGKKYTFESYEPKNGVNLSLNDLYQIVILRTKE